MTAIVPYKKGSLADQAGGLVANPQKVAAALRDAELMTVIDCSGSMSAEDAGPNEDQQRHEAAQECLDILQEKFPGKIAVGAFNGLSHGLVHTGILPDPAGNTPMYDAMDFFYPKAITTKMKFVLISDGEPDAGQGPKCISLARRYQYPIYAIYVGPPSNSLGGQEFLRRLAEASGGKFDHITLDNIKLLTDKIAGYLMAGV